MFFFLFFFMFIHLNFSSFFFFNDTATTEIYTISLHDALPIYRASCTIFSRSFSRRISSKAFRRGSAKDRKSTRLNSSHGYISYAVFCLKKKKKKIKRFLYDITKKMI